MSRWTKEELREAHYIGKAKDLMDSACHDLPKNPTSSELERCAGRLTLAIGCLQKALLLGTEEEFDG